jgi:hypothetical protein
MLSFAFFTLSISYLVKIFHFDPDTLRFAETVIITILVLTMVIPSLTARIEGFISRLTNNSDKLLRKGVDFSQVS